MAEKVCREHGDGWESILAPIEQEIERLGGTVERSKEKFAGLDIHYSEPVRDFNDALETAWDNVEMAVAAARTASLQTCEICGKPGLVRVNKRGSWLKTLCDEDGLSLGYKQVKK